MKKSDEVFEQIQVEQCKKYGITSCIKDGILYPGQFEKSPFRMLMILKEPYADWDDENQKPVSEDFDFADIIRNLKEIWERGLNKTWLKVAAIAYSLKNDTPYTENLSFEQVKEGLECVCWINLSKTPWNTLTNMDSKFYERTKAWEPVVKAQLAEVAELGYDIAWFGNTFDLGPLNPVEPYVGWDDFHDTFNEKWYQRTTEGGKKTRIQIMKYNKTDVIIVNGYHPGFGNSAEWTVECIKDYRENF